VEWTAVCCPHLPEGVRDKKYLTRKDYFPENGGFSVSVENVADFIVKEISEKNFINSRVGFAAAK
jgi:hypothetical protein